MGLDLKIGTEALDDAAAIHERVSGEYYTRWQVAWSIVAAAKSVVPVYDLSMLKMYMTAYRNPLIETADEHEAELVAAYRDGMTAFCFDRVKVELMRIIDWVILAIRQNEIPLMYRLVPPNCIQPLMRLNQMLNSSDAKLGGYGMDLTPHITAFITAIRSARAPRNTYTSDISQVDVVLPTVEFIKYAGAVRAVVSACVVRDNGIVNASASLDKIKHGIELIQGMLLLCAASTVQGTDSTDEIQERMRVCAENIDKSAPIQAGHLSMFGHLTHAHVFCSDIEYLVRNEVSSDNVTRPDLVGLLRAFLVRYEHFRSGKN